MDNFENRIKALAEKQEAEVNTEALWQGVSDQLHKKRKRRPLFWMFFGGLGIAFISVLSFLGLSDASFDSVTYDPQKLEFKDDKSRNVDRSVAEKLIKGDIDVEEVHIVSLGANSSAPSSNVNEQTNQLTDERPLDKREPKLSLRKGNSDSFYSAGQEDLQGGGGVDIAPLSPILKKTETIYRLPFAEDRGSPLVLGSFMRNTKTDFSMFALNQPLVSRIINYSISLKTNNDDLVSKELSMEYLFLSNRILLLENPIDASPEITRVINTSLSKVNKWSLAILGGMNLRQSSRKPLSDMTESFDIRQGATDNLLSGNLGFSMGYYLTPKWRLNSGLFMDTRISRSTEHLIFVEDAIEDDVLIQRIVSPRGISEVFGQAVTRKTTNSFRKRISRMYYVMIPLHLEYIVEKESFRTSYGLGVNVSKRIKSTGWIHIHENEEYDLAVDELSYLNQHLNLSTTLFVGLGKKLRPNLWLTGRVLFAKDINSQFVRGIGFSERDMSIQVQMGVEQKF